MRIALFSDIFTQLTGVTTHVQNLARELARTGHDVTLYTGRGNPKGPDGFKVKNLPHAPFVLCKDYDFIFPWPTQSDFDVAHVHTPYGAGWLGMLKNKPRVATTHTLPKNLFPSGRLDWLGWRYLIWFYNRFDYVICQTRSTEELFRKHGLKAPTAVISAAIDFDFYSRGDANAFRKKFGVKDFVLSTARLSAEKRPEWALKACSELGVPIVLTSDGPLRSPLQKKYPDAIFTGRLSKDDLRNAYAAARVFTLPSIEEGEGLAIQEAMAAGTPTINTALPCICDFIHDGVNGLTFTTFDEYKRKLKMLWDDNVMRARLAKSARKTAEDHDFKNCTKKVVQVYERAISTRKA